MEYWIDGVGVYLDSQISNLRSPSPARLLILDTGVSILKSHVSNLTSNAVMDLFLQKLALQTWPALIRIKTS